MNDYTKLIKDLKKQGYTIHRRRRHYQIRSGDTHVATFGATPSEYRGLKNVRSQVKRFERLSA